MLQRLQVWRPCIDYTDFYQVESFKFDPQVWITIIQYPRQLYVSNSIHVYNSDLYLMTLPYIYNSDISLHYQHFNEWPKYYYLIYNWWHWPIIDDTDLHLMTLTYIWWQWPTFDDNDLHFMTLTYIWWHQSHWSGTLCRCPSKFYCLQTVTWYSSGVPLEPLRWQGVCTVACLWQTGPEHLHLQTQESWCSDWPTKRKGRELYKHYFFFSGGQSLQAIAFYSNQKPS